MIVHLKSGSPPINTKTPLNIGGIYSLEEGKMKKLANQSIIFAMIAVLVLIPFGSAALAEEYFEAEEPEGGEMIYDAVIVRPIGMVATAIGSVFFVLTLPFSAAGDNVDAAQEELIKKPARFTFKRPLGEF
jgi:hypothetical protein